MSFLKKELESAEISNRLLQSSLCFLEKNNCNRYNINFENNKNANKKQNIENDNGKKSETQKNRNVPSTEDVSKTRSKILDSFLSSGLLNIANNMEFGKKRKRSELDIVNNNISNNNKSPDANTEENLCFNDINVLSVNYSLKDNNSNNYSKNKIEQSKNFSYNNVHSNVDLNSEKNNDSNERQTKYLQAKASSVSNDNTQAITLANPFIADLGPKSASNFVNLNKNQSLGINPFLTNSQLGTLSQNNLELTFKKDYTESEYKNKKNEIGINNQHEENFQKNLTENEYPSAIKSNFMDII